MVLHIGFQSVPYSQSSSPGRAQELPLSGTVTGQSATSTPVGAEASTGKPRPVELPPEAVIDVQAAIRIDERLEATTRWGEGMPEH